MNTNITEKHYYSKLLLVGEYALLMGGDALSICYDRYYGKWQYGLNDNPSLQPFLSFISHHESLSKIISITQFERELAKGLYFKSNILEGYGLGSSGALCAAVLDQFSNGNVDDLQEMKSILGMMESFFHGHSSGLDPLVSYLNQTLWIKQSSQIEKIHAPIHLKSKKFTITLHDSGKSRQTELLVGIFKEKVKSLSYREMYQHEILEVNKNLIEAFLQEDEDQIIHYWIQLSKNSLKIYDSFIPSHVRQFWEKGLERNDYYPKLCGAGGGGFFLNMTMNNI